MHKAVDLRVIKTQRAIQKALLELLSHDDGHDITPREVADKALITKKTFQAHYRSVRDAVEELERDAVTMISEFLDQQQIRTEEELIRTVERFAEMAEDRAGTLAVILNSRARDGFSAKMRLMLRDRIAASLGTCIEPSSLVPDFLAGGVVSAFGRWLRADARPSSQELGLAVVALFRRYGGGRAQSSAEDYCG